MVTYTRRKTEPKIITAAGIHRIMTELAEIILVDSLRPVRLMTMPLMLFAILGLWLGAKTDSELAFLYSVAPWYCWAGCFGYTLFMRGAGLFYWPWASRVVPSTSVIGILLWSTIFTSAAIIDKFDGMEILYLLPAILETLILARQIGIKEHGH